MKKKVLAEYKRLVGVAGREGASASSQKKAFKYMRDAVADKKDVIRAAYQKNKDKIAAAAPELSARARSQGFYDNVASVMLSGNMSVNKAIKRVLHSGLYTDKADIFKENLLAGLRTDKSAYDAWRSITQRQKIDYTKIKYEGENQYSYTIEMAHGTKIVYVSMDESPRQVNVWYEFKKYENGINPNYVKPARKKKK